MVSHHFFFRHMFRPLDLKNQKSLRQKNSKVPKLPNPEFSKESDLCRRRKVVATVICDRKNARMTLKYDAFAVMV